ncbi:MAG: OsmC family protein [Bacillota bacterium]
MAEAKEVKLIPVRAKASWEGGYKVGVQVRQLPKVYVDEPPEVGGTDAGPSPMEYMLAGLEGCETMTIIWIAKQMGLTITDVQVESVGYIDPRGMKGVEGVRPHFQEVRQVVKVTTPEPEEKIAALREAVQKRCPVYSLFKDAGVAPVSEWKIINA